MLNGRGRKAAKAMGRFLAREGPLPARVLCSSSARTQETWTRVAACLEPAGAAPLLRLDRRLYLAGASELLERIQACDDEACLLLIAHNPGTADLARALAGSGDEEAWHGLRGKYPTGALATLAFDATCWSAVGPSQGELVRFVVPRDLA